MGLFGIFGNLSHTTNTVLLKPVAPKVIEPDLNYSDTLSLSGDLESSLIAAGDVEPTNTTTNATTTTSTDVADAAVVPVTAEPVKAAQGKLSVETEQHISVLARKTREIDVKRTANDQRGVSHHKQNDAVYAFETAQREIEIRETIREFTDANGNVKDWAGVQKAFADKGNRCGEVYAGLQRVDTPNGTFTASTANFETIGIKDKATIDAILTGIGVKEGENVSAAQIAKFMADPKNQKLFENDPGLVQAFGVHVMGKAGDWEGAKAIASYDFKGVNAVEDRQKFMEMLQLIQKCLEAYQQLVSAYFALRKVPGSGNHGVVA